MELEHPVITQMNKFGYPFEQPEHSGIDVMGDEILSGDKIYEFDGETILEDNLERFLVDHLGFKIREAK